MMTYIRLCVAVCVMSFCHMVLSPQARAVVTDACARTEQSLDFENAVDPTSYPGKGEDVVTVQESDLIIIPSKFSNYTAMTPYVIDKSVLLDIDKWPTLTLTRSGKTQTYIGLFVTNRTDANPCIRTLYRIFTPKLTNTPDPEYLRKQAENNEPTPIPQQYFLCDYESGHPRTIPVGVSVGDIASFDTATEKFYVINITNMMKDRTDASRLSKFVHNSMNETHQYTAIAFERLLLDVIRWSRIPKPDKFKVILNNHRSQLFSATDRILKTSPNSIDCAASADDTACVIEKIFLQTELGSADPLALTDALDNSGLTFGARQLDLGQGRDDATKFAVKYLIAGADEADWRQRIMKPIEQMKVEDLTLMYGKVIKTWDDRLVNNTDAVAVDFVDTVTSSAKKDYQLDSVKFAPGARGFAQVIVADFENKWPKYVNSTVANLRRPDITYTVCSLPNGWISAVKARFGASQNTDDAKRRLGLVQSTFFLSSPAATAACNKAPLEQRRDH